jgi:hypothetical protein
MNETRAGWRGHIKLWFRALKGFFLFVVLVGLVLLRENMVAARGPRGANA